MAEAVPVAQGSGRHVGDDVDIAVRVGRETAGGWMWFSTITRSGFESAVGDAAKMDSG